MQQFSTNITHFKENYFYVYDKVNKTFSEYYDEDEAVDTMEKNKGVLFYCYASKSFVYKKATIDFDKREITVEGAPLMIVNKQYSIGINPLDEDDYHNWERLMLTFKNKGYTIKILGTPYFEGTDITNEMSDL